MKVSDHLSDDELLRLAGFAHADQYASAQAKTSTPPPPGPSSHPMGPEELALPGAVRLRSVMRQLPEPPLCPFFAHICCVAEGWAHTGAEDRTLRRRADISVATASANERTST